MDPDSTMFAYITLTVAALLLNAFFTMSEAAIVTLNDSKLRKLAQAGNKKAVQISRLVEHPSRFFAIHKVGGALSGFCAFTLALNILGPWLMLALLTQPVPLFWAFVISYLLAGVFCVGLILVLGDLVPRRLAIRHHEKFAFFAAGPISAFAWLSRPLV